jgi:hypothetical protein
MPSSKVTLSKTPSETVDPTRRRLLGSTCATTTLTPLDVLRDFCAPFSSSNRINDDNNDMRVLPASYCPTTTFLLLVGSEGSGKTFTCDEMERFATEVEIASLHGKNNVKSRESIWQGKGEPHGGRLTLTVLLFFDSHSALFANGLSGSSCW